MSLIDSILSAREAVAPVVLNEVHDVNRINWVNGLTDPGEMIRCGYLPEIRRMTGESDAVYAARITPIVMQLPERDRQRIMGAAIGRAGLDTSNGRVNVMVAGQAPWHGLGVHVANAVNSADAIRFSGLDWTVSKVPAFFNGPNGEVMQMTDTFAMRRNDTGFYLGSVGTRYTPIQNREGFEFLDSVIGEFGAKYHTAGAVFDGKRVWMLVELPNQSFNLHGKDETLAYALFTNSHDGTGAARCIPTSERVVCHNTLRIALEGGHGSGLNIRHTGDVRGKVADARKALGLAVKGFDKLHHDAEVFARTPLKDSTGYFDGILDSVLDMTAARAAQGADLLTKALAMTEAGQRFDRDRLDAERKKFERQIETRKELLEDMLHRYESERCGINGMRGTVWAGLNAVTEHADHNKITRYTGSDHARASRRFESVLSGDADELKQVAYTAARTLAV